MFLSNLKDTPRKESLSDVEYRFVQSTVLTTLWMILFTPAPKIFGMSCTACPFHRIIFLRGCVPWQSNDSVQAYSTTKIGPQRWKLTAVQHNKWAVPPWSLNARPLGDADDPTRLLVFESVDKESPGSCATVEATLQQCLCQFLSLMAQILDEFAVPLK